MLGLLEEMADQLERTPTLAEFAEVFSRSVPAEDARIDIERSPAVIVATAGNKRVSGDTAQVDDLEDHVYAAVSNVFNVLVTTWPGSDAPKLSALLVEISEVLREMPAQSVTGVGRNTRLKLQGPSAHRRPQPGDVVSIPSGKGGYRLAVVVARNRFGIAYGLFKGRHAIPRIPGNDHAIYPLPVYSDDRSVTNGTWKILGTRESLLQRFPRDPVIYHFKGPAESPDGTLRELSEEEVVLTELAKSYYNQAYMSHVLQDELDQGLCKVGI
ncbi:hypothetical protein ACQEVZ_07180 [Dactylosporangium sp. CA-152071]|uniref:hypothetical protein n=1 Tax=Dactylosporangium sp. CA-152071 TaxID=3239933 RepID=UPI003D942F20